MDNGLIGKDYPQGCKELIKSLPARVMALLWKVISFQGLVFAVGSWLLYEGKLEPYAWVVMVVLVMFGRIGLDVIREIKR